MSKFNISIVLIGIFILLMSIFYAGVQVAQASIVGLGFVVGLAILIHKFKFVRYIVFKFSRIFDLLVFVVSFYLANGVFAYVSAVFIGIYTSVFLVFAEKLYSKKS